MDPIANFSMVILTSMMDMNMNQIKKVNTIISSINLRMKMAIAAITKMDEADNIENGFHNLRYAYAKIIPIWRECIMGFWDKDIQSIQKRRHS